MHSAFLTVCILLLVTSCRNSKHTFQPASVEAVPAPKMIFLAFRIQRDSTTGSITLLEKKAVEGKIKGDPQNFENTERLVISIVGKNHLVLYSEQIPHPLFRDVETANSNGQFERKNVTLKEAEFFVRMRLPDGSDWVLVEEFIGNKRVNSAEFPLNK